MVPALIPETTAETEKFRGLAGAREKIPEARRARHWFAICALAINNAGRHY
jgi:hypothetical protein